MVVSDSSLSKYSQRIEGVNPYAKVVALGAYDCQGG